MDKTVGSRVWRHTQGSCGRPASDPGWRSSSKTAPGSQSTGSLAGRTPPHGDGSMYNQANVRAGKWLRPPLRALPSVIVDTEKVLREADGPVEMSALTLPPGGKVFAPGCASENWTVRAREEKSTSGDKRLNRLISYIHHACEIQTIVMWVILPSNADWDCFKTLTSREILKLQNPLLEEHCAFLEVIHLFP